MVLHWNFLYTNKVKNDKLIETTSNQLQNMNPMFSPFNMNQMMDPYFNEAKQLISQYLSDEKALERLCNTNPEMAEMIVSEDTIRLAEVIRKKHQKQMEKKRKEQEELIRLQQNSFDPEAQKRIEEIINQQRLDALQKETYEHHPELFVSTEMLYINGSVNNEPVQVFMDTGAQTTVISKAFAVKANLMKNVDKRFAGLIKGVGEQKSLGRIWNFNLKIQGSFFPVTAVVLEHFSHEVLFGLDAMKRHKVQIDLGDMVVHFPSANIIEPFLKDHEIFKIPLDQMSQKVSKVMETLGIDDKLAKELLVKNNYDEIQAINTFYYNR